MQRAGEILGEVTEVRTFFWYRAETARFKSFQYKREDVNTGYVTVSFERFFTSVACL